MVRQFNISELKGFSLSLLTGIWNTLYNVNNNEVIANDIHNLHSLLIKFKEELLADIDARHKNGEMVSRNEAIIKKTEIDINNLISDINHFI